VQEFSGVSRPFNASGIFFAPFHAGGRANRRAGEPPFPEPGSPATLASNTGGRHDGCELYAAITRPETLHLEPRKNLDMDSDPADARETTGDEATERAEE